MAKRHELTQPTGVHDMCADIVFHDGSATDEYPVAMCLRSQAELVIYGIDEIIFSEEANSIEERKRYQGSRSDECFSFHKICACICTLDEIMPSMDIPIIASYHDIAIAVSLVNINECCKHVRGNHCVMIQCDYPFKPFLHRQIHSLIQGCGDANIGLVCNKMHVWQTGLVTHHY